MGHLGSAGHFLISLLFDIAIFSLWLRIAFRYWHVSPLNPYSQLIDTITSPLVKPLTIVFKSKSKYDWSAFLIIILLEGLKLKLFSVLFYHTVSLPITGYLLYIQSEIIVQPCTLLLYAVLIRVLMSYMNPGWKNPLSSILQAVTNPLLRLGHKIIPNISGFDFSPFIVLVFLELIILLFSIHGTYL